MITVTISEPQHDKTNKIICAPSKDSDPPSLIRVFAAHTKKHWVIPTHEAHSKDCTDWLDVQADRSLH